MDLRNSILQVTLRSGHNSQGSADWTLHAGHNSLSVELLHQSCFVILQLIRLVKNVLLGHELHVVADWMVHA